MTKGNYKSKISRAIHELATKLHEVQAISDEEMRAFDKSCKVPKPTKVKK